MCSFFKKENGFTLIELIAVILIASILSVSAMSKWSGTGINIASEAERIASDIRYVQSYASTHDQRYRINFLASSYGFTNGTGLTVLLHPVTNASSITMTSGVSLTYAHTYLVFDGKGIPYTNTAVPGTALATTATITLTSGTSSRTVQVSPETGRVVVQ